MSSSRAPPYQICPTRPDDEVRSYFPSLDPLIRQIDGHTASEYVQTLKNKGYKEERLPSGDTKLNTLHEAMRGISSRVISSYGDFLTAEFQEQEQTSGGEVIKIDKARYVYSNQPDRNGFLLRMEPSADNPNGPCALILEAGSRIRGLVLCDPESRARFCEVLRDDDSVISQLTCGSLDHVYTGGSYFI